MKSVHAELRAAFGSPRMHRQPHHRGHCVGLYRVERLSREKGMRARQMRGFKSTIDPKHSVAVSAGLAGAKLHAPVAQQGVYG